MSTLERLDPETEGERVGDFVFVHGLNGDARGTWTTRNGEFWPTWLVEEFPTWAAWSLGYDAAATRWTGSPMPLADRATNVLALLDAYDLGRRPICFITHSMGGLLVKQMLRHARTLAGGFEHVADQSRGVVFLATPHSGSSLASYSRYINKLVRRAATLEDLEKDEVHLRELNTWYRNNVNALGIRNQVYFETRETLGVLVVTPSSADPGIEGVIPIPVDANHEQICKPDSRNELVFLRTRKFLRDSIATDIVPIEIIIRASWEAFDGTEEQKLRRKLSVLLDLPLEDIEVVRRERGSVRLLLNLPPAAADQLISGIRRKNPAFMAALSILSIERVAVGHGRTEGSGAVSATPESLSRQRDRLEEEKRGFPEETKADPLESRLVGESGNIQAIRRQIAVAARTSAPVLVTGESGSGKELVARTIHELSKRRRRTFVAVNLSALPPDLAEAELFGFEKGAFTGAERSKPGQLEMADGGSLFLEGIESAARQLQSKLLRFLEEGSVLRMGGTVSKEVDVRLLASAGPDMEQSIREKRIEGRLLYRLAGLSIHILPLRERREDIPLLVKEFARELGQKLAKEFEAPSAAQIRTLQAYDWPGNVRELRAYLELSMILSNPPLLDLGRAGVPGVWSAPSHAAGLELSEREAILEALRRANGDFATAAKILEIHPEAIVKIMRRLGIREGGS